MSNILLRTLREAGVITGAVLPFARANAAVDFMKRWNTGAPDKPRAVMVLDAVNNGDYWLVTEEDAVRLEAKGYIRYVTQSAPAGPEPELQ